MRLIATMNLWRYGVAARKAGLDSSILGVYYGTDPTW